MVSLLLNLADVHVRSLWNNEHVAKHLEVRDCGYSFCLSVSLSLTHVYSLTRSLSSTHTIGRFQEPLPGTWVRVCMSASPCVSVFLRNPNPIYFSLSLSTTLTHSLRLSLQMHMDRRVHAREEATKACMVALADEALDFMQGLRPPLSSLFGEGEL